MTDSSDNSSATKISSSGYDPQGYHIILFYLWVEPPIPSSLYLPPEGLGNKVSVISLQGNNDMHCSSTGFFTLL